MDEGWEDRAEDWLRWAREPGFDPYWSFEAAFAELLPPPAGPALDVGCGEGRTTRALAASGHDVLGLDASPTLVAAARGADPGRTYVVGDAGALPFPDDAFALVCAYNVLMDVPDAGAAVREAARVLAPGGALCLCVTHPTSMAGTFEEDGRFVHTTSYLATEHYDDPFELGGLRMRFDGVRRPLEAYARLLEDAGLLIAALREPVPAPPHAARLQRFHDVPMFLMLRAVPAPR